MSQSGSDKPGIFGAREGVFSRVPDEILNHIIQYVKHGSAGLTIDEQKSQSTNSEHDENPDDESDNRKSSHGGNGESQNEEAQNDKGQNEDNADGKNENDKIQDVAWEPYSERNLRDSHALTLVSRRFNRCSIPHLYERLTVHVSEPKDSEAHRRQALLHRILLDNPQLRAECKKLVIRVHNNPEDDPRNEKHVPRKFAKFFRHPARKIARWLKDVQELDISWESFNELSNIAKEFGLATEQMTHLQKLDLYTPEDELICNWLHNVPGIFGRIESLKLGIGLCPSEHLVRMLKSLPGTASFKHLTFVVDATIGLDGVMLPFSGYLGVLEAILEFSRRVKSCTATGFDHRQDQTDIDRLGKMLKHHATSLKSIVLSPFDFTVQFGAGDRDNDLFVLGQSGYGDDGLLTSEPALRPICGLDLSSFTELEQLSIPSQITGLDSNWAIGHLAPQLKEFSWVLNHNISRKLSDNPDLVLGWVMALMEESRKRATSLKMAICFRSFFIPSDQRQSITDTLKRAIESRGLDVSIKEWPLYM